MTTVTFTGDVTRPTVTVRGTGFGTAPPATDSADRTGCGTWANNGSFYGASGLVFDDAGHFSAGVWTASGPQSCIGLLVKRWTPTEVAWQFGAAYGAAPLWLLSDGDHFVVTVLGTKKVGTVSGLTTPSHGGPPTVTSVTLSGPQGSPTITVTGRGLGASPPTGYPAGQTTCGSYSDNGDWYGPSGLWFQDTANFTAGEGTEESDGSCIGLVVTSWSPTQVTFRFGNAYDTYTHWYVSNGDQFTITVLGVQFTGSVSGVTSAG